MQAVVSTSPALPLPREHAVLSSMHLILNDGLHSSYISNRCFAECVSVECFGKVCFILNLSGI